MQPPLQRARVLVVTADKATREIAAAAMGPEYEPIWAQTAGEASSHLNHGNLDVVCSDYALSDGSSGLELLRKASALPTFVGRVLMATYDEYSTGVAVKKNEGYYLVIRPFAGPAFLRSLNQAWNTVKTRRASHKKVPL